MRALGLFLLASGLYAQTGVFPPPGGGGSTSPGSPDGSFQTGQGGAFRGTPNLTWDYTQITPAIALGTNSSNPGVIFGGTYTGSVHPTTFKVTFTGTGTFSWQENSGTTTTGVACVAYPTAPVVLSHGVTMRCGATSGFTSGDTFYEFTSSGGQLYSQIPFPLDHHSTVALAGAGAGNTINGPYNFYVSNVTPEGDGYGDLLSQVTVVDHTTNGKIVISNFPPTSNPRAIGWYLYAETPSGPPYKVVDFIPNGVTSYVYNFSDAYVASLPTPVTGDRIDTDGPCILGGRDLVGTDYDGSGMNCVLQPFDFGVRVPHNNVLFLDDIPTGFLSTGSNVDLNMVGSNAPHGTMAEQVQMSDGTGTQNHAPLFAADGSLTDGPAGVTVSGTSCTVKAIVNGIITSATCP